MHCMQKIIGRTGTSKLALLEREIPELPQSRQFLPLGRIVRSQHPHLKFSHFVSGALDILTQMLSLAQVFE
jgi:hypothetical protein